MIVPYDEETIIAQATPKGSGALAIVRLSGTIALDVTTSISKLSSEKKICDLPTHTIHLGWIIDEQGTYIDQVLFLIMHAPKTFTGQNTVEINCHNNPFIIEQIIQAAIAKGARLAGPGEFSKRAVLNNKIDLLQAEAINELIHSQTQMGLKQSLSQVEGSLSHVIIQLEQELLKALAFCEASFEFIDEEMHFDKQINEIIHNLLVMIRSLKKAHSYQQQIRQGIRIALIGAVNAGKSSLFNALLQKQRAIVTEVAGTTRDVIEAGLFKNGNYWTLVDTAGLRETDNEIEQEGIHRALREAQLADIILLVYDGSRDLTSHEHAQYKQIIERYKNKIIIVHNKADLGMIKPQFDLKPYIISIKTDQNLALLEQVLVSKITELFEHIESPFLLNQRQYRLIISLEHALDEIKIMLSPPVHYELVSHHLKDALSLMSELTGKTISEKGMDQIFRQFCVGK